MKILGIDLGTSNTYVYGAHKSSSAPHPVILPRVSAPDGCVETAILYENDSPLLIGHLAESEYYANASLRSRRELRSQFKPEIGEENAEAARWMTDFLRMLRKELPQDTLESDSQIFVGVPSRTRESFGISLSQCFKDAGWPAPSLIKESDAAMISCLQSGAIELDDLEHSLLILDFGGGTCDFTLAENSEILQCGGDRLLGGRLFDDLLFQLFCRHNPGLLNQVQADVCEYYVHWVLCKAEKERFSKILQQDVNSAVSLHLSWFDAQGKQKHAYLHELTWQQVVNAAESYTASESLLGILRQYANRGALGAVAGDMLQGRQVGLISWFKDILYEIRRQKSIDKVILTGGSSGWFFAHDAVRDVFGTDNIVMSPRTYEDIAFGLALYPMLLNTHLRIKTLLEEQSEDFCMRVSDLAQGIFEKHTKMAAKTCAERIAVRDILSVLESAQEARKTVEDIEREISERIQNDTGLLTIVQERTEAARKEIEKELRLQFNRWLRENGVYLAPRLNFSAHTLSTSFFDAVQVKVSRLTLLNTMDVMAVAVLPGVAAFAIGEKMLLTTGEPISAVLGGAAAFAGTWALGKFGKKFLQRQRLPKFLLNEKNREKITAKNREYIEEVLGQAFQEIRQDLMEDARSKIRYALKGLLQRLTVLNHIRVERGNTV
ncbi:Hsp70 family protein [Desulfovibrio intestinalis]|uniref:Molecular chaperone DnaK (HSP70) n=1 Tax=Desulfovibrio intestinalis TaxID=58621 RepID=A0A7W8FD74_9BACT|nr:molecular chaperone [Desulfovibrio intestinalis]MBB5142399.1 molecular chaperone DnaK (HSP70) [Desulfovibrio intestinalis]